MAAELSVGPPSLREEGVKKEEGRLRLPRMLHGAARELRRYDETEALGWRLLGTLARGQYAAEPLMEVVALADGIAADRFAAARGAGDGGRKPAAAARRWARSCCGTCRSATLPRRRRAARKWR